MLLSSLGVSGLGVFFATPFFTAALHRVRLGDLSGVESARLLGEAIDNPMLHAELAAAV